MQKRNQSDQGIHPRWSPPSLHLGGAGSSPFTMRATRFSFRAFLICFVMCPGLATAGEEPGAASTSWLYDLSLGELAHVEITSAARSSEKIEEIPASVVLITRQEIDSYGYATLTELLGHIPGLYQIDDYQEGAKLGLRGFWSGVTNRNIIVLVDGVKQVEDRDQSSPLNKIAVPVESIERVEVVRGPLSVIYGPGALFGVINIITHKPDSASSSRVSASYGQRNTKRAFIRVMDKMGELEFALNATFYGTDGIDEPYSRIQTTPSPGVAGLSTENRLEDGERYLNLFASFRDWFFDTSFVRSEKEFFFPLPAVADGSLRTTEAANLAVGYARELSPTLSLDGKLVYSSNDAHLRYDIRRPDWDGNQRWKSSALEFELNGFWLLNPNLDVTVGMNRRSVLDLSDRFHIPSSGFPSTQHAARLLVDGEHIVTQALFSQANYHLSNDLLLVAGVRAEQQLPYRLSDSKAAGLPEFTFREGKFDEDGITLIPRAAAIYNLNDRHIFKAMYGEAINRPSFLQNITNTLDPNRDSLEPEKIETLELNYITTLSQRMRVNLSLFHNVLTDLITRQAEFVGGDYTTFSGNGGKLVTDGIEMTVQSRPIAALGVELSGTYQSTEDEDAADRTVAYSPNILGYMRALYSLSAKTSVALTGNYVDSVQPFYDITLVDPDLGVEGEQKGRIGHSVEGYVTLGANLRTEDFYYPGVFINIRGSNLLDSTIRYPSFTTNAWADKGTLGTGRAVLATVGWKY